MQNALELNFASILSAVREAALRAGRDEKNVSVLAVTKGQSLDKINAYVRYINSQGAVALLGENYFQEYLQKKALIKGNFEMHYIGNVQSGKISSLLDEFKVVQSFWKISHLEKLRQVSTATEKSLGIYLQVNVSEDSAKGGVLPAELNVFFAKAVEIFKESQVSILGLMTILENYEDRTKILAAYQRLAKFRNSLQAEHAKHLPDSGLKLSMGMSADFDLAIEAGADIVRIGSALFGER